MLCHTKFNVIDILRLKSRVWDSNTAVGTVKKLAHVINIGGTETACIVHTQQPPRCRAPVKAHITADVTGRCSLLGCKRDLVPGCREIALYSVMVVTHAGNKVETSCHVPVGLDIGSCAAPLRLCPFWCTFVKLKYCGGGLFKYYFNNRARKE